MKKLACIFLLAVMLVNCLFVSMPAYAAFETSQTFTAVADGHYDTNPTFKGTETSLMTTQVQHNKPNASDVGRTAFLKFGLTDIKSNIAAGAEISKATVKLYVSKQLYTGSTVAYMSLFAHDDNWDEAGNNPVIYNVADLVTVSKDPQNPSNGYVSLPAGLAAGTEITLDITDALKAEAAKADDDYLSLEVGYRGVWISSGTTYFYSRENTTEA